ncbi:aspartate aminotransferase family protein [Falsirhodobacter algicola]|uniref:Aminotransferase class III-fold pyridoxal phosphate-dependent enzyme n=1 Tax=Falsirhodobacter algicola TaxID=2692330 RepID=A0A8J8MVW8_9RHOB|nr:aspartate aminotransferase family protein [Falsirhodobacter algicola]QUS37203.1 aminotransferase class III-fold pyridoxal phosphate-dependent enzyme [Falsirhodobacter algicola]
MTHLPNSLQGRDIRFLMHPVTNARAHERTGPLVIARGEGVRVFDEDGNAYIEGMAGLWSVALGFSEPRLVEAATRQMERLPYMHLFSSRGQEPSIALAEKLVQMTPEGLDRVHFTNSGSEANDTVIKMVWFWNNAIGRPEKKKFIARLKGYHGITIGSGSLTGLPGNHKGFDLPLDFVRHVSTPHHWREAHEGESEEAFSDRLAAELEAVILAEGPGTVAAFIAEPLVGAGGVIEPPAGYWRKVQEVCRRHDVLIVADEVINGFGRTGRMFACETYDIAPDILVLSKQITSSYQPLAAIVFSDRIYQGIADGSERLGTFGHGFTTAGHPVATAVALENLAIIEERGLVEHAAAMGRILQAGLRRHADHPHVGEVRGTGLIAAVEFVEDKAAKQGSTPPGRLAQAVAAAAQRNGLLLRPIGEAVCFCPPLIITEAEMEELLERFARAMGEVFGA